MSGSSSLVLIRHAEAQNRTAAGGYVADGALTDRGITQAQRLSDSLRGLPIKKAWTSPCRRARQTAALAGLDAVVLPGLAEWRYQPYAKALEAGLAEAGDPLWIWQQATGAQRDAPETLDQLVHRIDAALAYITARITEGAVTAIVAHGHLLRVLTMRWLGLPASTAAHLQRLRWDRWVLYPVIAGSRRRLILGRSKPLAALRSIQSNSRAGRHPDRLWNQATRISASGWLLSRI
jgi:probable phosphoglycerate mutase